MPTDSPSEMSNEELVKRFGRDYAGLANSTDPEYDWSDLNDSESELLRRLNRAEGLEARLIAVIELLDSLHVDMPYHVYSQLHDALSLIAVEAAKSGGAK